MRTLNRRDFCLCLACSPVASPAHAVEDEIYTCNLSFNRLASSVDKSTIKPLDLMSQSFANGLLSIHRSITDFLDISLEIFTYDDRRFYNAAFTPDLTFCPPGWSAELAKDGIILLGENFINELKAYFGDLSAPLTAICAHEAGHALQAKYGLGGWQTYSTKPIQDDFYEDRYELCADFICGYVAHYRKSVDERYFAATQAVTQFNKGDAKPVGHGTFQQRGEAVAAGYRYGKTGVTDSDAALSAGINYVFSVQFG